MRLKGLFLSCLIILCTSSVSAAGVDGANGSRQGASDPTASEGVSVDVVGSESITNSIGMELRLIGPGSFMMGSNDGHFDERPIHKVTISKPFYIGVHEVTQEQWQSIMGNNPSAFKGKRRPVESITWHDAEEFCRRLSLKEGVTYRLPTEAQWEYAARAGAETSFYWGNTVSEDHVWYVKNSEGQTHPVGLKQPNAWGLYDVSGNVWEWCEDKFRNYTTEDVVDPVGSKLILHVLRGGGWSGGFEYCRLADRTNSKATLKANNLGFRVVRVK